MTRTIWFLIGIVWTALLFREMYLVAAILFAAIVYLDLMPDDH